MGSSLYTLFIWDLPLNVLPISHILNSFHTNTIFWQIVLVIVILDNDDIYAWIAGFGFAGCNFSGT